MHKFNIFLCFLGLFIFIIYNVYVIYKNGLTNSLSSTYYTKEGRRFMRPVMVITGLCLWFPGIEVISENYIWTLFLAIMGFMFVLATPHSQDLFENKIHTPAAILSFIGAQFYVIFTNPLLLYKWILIIPLYFVRKNSLILWVEYICFGTFILSILKGLL